MQNRQKSFVSKNDIYNSSDDSVMFVKVVPKNDLIENKSKDIKIQGHQTKKVKEEIIYL